MQEHWEKLGTEIDSLKAHLEELLEMLPQSAKFYTATANINKQWKRLQHAVNDLDPFITPVKSIQVTNALLAHQNLANAWQLWKDYLIEQHGMHMRSRAEAMALKRLSEISGAKPDTAVRYLEFAMSRCDRNFYVVNEAEQPAAATTSSTQSTGKTVIKLPVKYQQPTTPVALSVPVLTETSGVEVRQPIFKQKTLGEEIAEFKKSRRIQHKSN